jgi:hypothetical protein
VFSVPNGLIAVVCMVLLVYAGVVMFYVTRHDGLPPPLPRSVRKFDRADRRTQSEDAIRDRDDL